MPENSLSAEKREQCRIAAECLLAVSKGQILRFTWGGRLEVDPTQKVVELLFGSGVELVPLEKPEVKLSIQATLPPPPPEWLDRMGLELTGEFRRPFPGEIVACMDSPTLYVPCWDKDNTTIASQGNIWHRWILRKRALDPRPPKPTQAQLDRERYQYAGFECTDEYREPNRGEAYYQEDNGVLIRIGNGPKGPRWILRKKPSHPRPTEEWLRSVGLRIVSEHMTWGEAQDKHPNERAIWIQEQHDESTSWKAPQSAIKTCGRGNVNDHAYLVEAV